MHHYNQLILLIISEIRIAWVWTLISWCPKKIFMIVDLLKLILINFINIY